MAIQDSPNDKYQSISRLKHIFFKADQPIILFESQYLPIIAYAKSWKSDFFSIMDSAYAILVLCSRQVLVMSKDHPRK